MYFCYIDESGTSDLGDNSTHFVLVGISIPVWQWTKCEADISRIKAKHNLENSEIHTAWMLREYREQMLIPGFERMSIKKRRSEVEILRKSYLHSLQVDPKKVKSYSQTRKNYLHTQKYIHLTLDERKAFIKEIAVTIGGWGFARLFAECINKIKWDQTIAKQTIDEQSFEQIISRFERFLKNLSKDPTLNPKTIFGLIIHDNSQSVEKKYTELMKRFQSTGTLWTSVKKIIETPLFVNSELTSMVQIADVCAYSIRKYLEKGETELFNEIYKRADRKDGISVGIRHYPPSKCKCIICSDHKRC
jgi:hypothetical protein